jgi:hypothetical protein
VDVWTYGRKERGRKKGREGGKDRWRFGWMLPLSISWK